MITLPDLCSLDTSLPPDIQAKLFDAQIECVRFCDQAYNSPLADPLRVILRHTEAFFSTRYGGKDITPAGYLWTAAPELQRLAKTPIKLPYLDTNTQEELIANSKNLNNAFCMQKALEWVEEKMIPYYPLGVYKDKTAEEAAQ